MRVNRRTRKYVRWSQMLMRKHLANVFDGRTKPGMEHK